MMPAAHTDKLVLPSPAKVNVFLAVTGLRPDGFHDLLSVAAPLDFGDTLEVSTAPPGCADTLECGVSGVPRDGTNLILKAAVLFRECTGLRAFFHFHLHKRIPMGAGLGGGSGNAATALRAMNQLCGDPLTADALASVCARLGSDCPLFLENRPRIMRGRGELLDALPPNALTALQGRDLILFKPEFSIATPWAYAALKATNGRDYLSPGRASDMLDEWLRAPNWPDFPLYNNLQDPVFRKYLALPELLLTVRHRFKLRCLMSGSGSACFAVCDAHTDRDALQYAIREAWGDLAWIVQTRIAG